MNIEKITLMKEASGMKKWIVVLTLVAMIAVFIVPALADEFGNYFTEEDQEYFRDYARKRVVFHKEFIQGMVQRGFITQKHADYMFDQLVEYEAYIESDEFGQAGMNGYGMLGYDCGMAPGMTPGMMNGYGTSSSFGFYGNMRQMHEAMHGPGSW